jgi:hypothetical protein
MSYENINPESTWCDEDGCPAAICGGPHWLVLVQLSADRRQSGTPILMRADQFASHKLIECPQCASLLIKKPVECPHPFHTSDDTTHNYGAMMNREGYGADAGGQADPLVKEPNK